MVLRGTEAEYVSKDELIALGKIKTFDQPMEILHVLPFSLEYSWSMERPANQMP
jgi:hypothetical protein